MSLINDALKRASQSDKSRPRDAAPPPVMLPAPERRASIIPLLLAVAVAVVVLLSLAMAGLLLRHALSRNDNLAAAPPPTAFSEAPAQITNDKFSMANSQSTVSALVASPLPVAASTNDGRATLPRSQASPSVPAAAVASPTNDPAPEPPPFPDLKLQAIFYSRANPKAVINGQTVGEKEIVSGVSVVSITQNKVTVEWSGQTRDLNLQGP
jgi:hypothetical protein